MTLLSSIQNYYSENKYDPDHIHVLYCDHQTRPEIAQEIELVRTYTPHNRFTSVTYDWQAKDEASLRARRHEQFVAYCQQHNITTLLTGHHLDDRIETTLLNLSRGARLQGMLSLQVHDQHFLDESIAILRPLIHTSKQDILRYCNNHDIHYAIDQSNFDPTTSQRNHIRSLIQALDSPNRSKSFDHLYSLLESIETSQSLETWARTSLESFHIIEQDGEDLLTIRSGDWTPELLYELYRHYDIALNPRSTTLGELSQQLNHQSGNKILYQGLEIRAYRYASIVSQAL